MKRNRNICRFVGKRFGYLTITAVYHENHRSYTEYKCDCGKKGHADLSNIREGRTTSCGCRMKVGYLLGMNHKHGLSQTRIYDCWNKMYNHCYNKDDRSYKWYGGSGIRMCREWKKDFVVFYKWAMEHGFKDGLCVYRKDIRKGYTPDNCVVGKVGAWANNRSNSRKVTYKGVTKNMTTWARELGMYPQTLQQRLYVYGWSVKKAFETPTKKKL